MIMSATQPLMPNLVIVRLAGARRRIGEIVTPVSIFYLSKNYAHRRQCNVSIIYRLWSQDVMYIINSILEFWSTKNGDNQGAA